MTKQQKRKKTRKQSQKEEEEEELLAKEHRTKKRHETTVSTLVHPPAATSIPRRLKDLSETNEEDEGLVQVSLQKRKEAALVAPAPKRAKKFQLVSQPRVFVISFAIPRRIKTRVTKANPKIDGKEWAISFNGNNQDSASSSSSSSSLSYSESINNTSISPFRNHDYSTQSHIPPSPIHLDKFKRSTPREPLRYAQIFPLAFFNSNPISETPYFEFLYFKLVERETIHVQEPTWTKHECEHTSSEAFKALPTYDIVHLPLTQWTYPV